VRKDGALFWSATVIDCIRDENGDLVGFAKITRDITERRDAQSALQRAQGQLAQSQKMEALAQLTGGVAHDFNNLLTIVGGHAQIIKRGYQHDPKVMRAVDAINLAAKRGVTLTRQLLSFSRQQRLNPESLDLKVRIEAFRIMLATLGAGPGADARPDQRRHLADRGRRGGVRAGAAQRGAECARCHAGRRRCHHRGAQRLSRPRRPG